MRSKKFFFMIMLAILVIGFQAGSPVNAETIRRLVISGVEDATLTQSNSAFTTTGYCWTGDNTAVLYDYESGLRFRNITIPNGATITSAWIEVTAQAAIYGSDPALFIGGQDSDTASVFSNLADYQARPRTTQNVTWTPTGWGGSQPYNTSDISPVIQEIIDRAGWVSGNDVAVFIGQYDGWTSQSIAVFYSYDINPALVPELWIEWAVPSYPSPAEPVDLFGAGFNDSTPYVELHWDQDLNNTDFFEIQGSVNTSSWDTLGYSNSTEYLDYNVSNGLDRYYRVRACIDQPDGWHNSSFSEINFETVYFIPSDITINYLAGSWVEYNVSSVFNATGDLVSGNTSSLAFVDGIYYWVDEVTGIPGFDIRYNWTGIPENSTSLAVMSYCQYEGNPAHDVDMEGYNFDSGLWVDLVHLPEHNFEWMNASLSLGGFIQDGKVWIRTIHHTNGVGTHWIKVDYIRLRAFVPIEVINLDAWSITWLIGILWLGLVAIGIFKDDKILIMFAGMFGIILGLLLLGDSAMGSIALICLNLYLLYEGTQ